MTATDTPRPARSSVGTLLDAGVRVGFLLVLASTLTGGPVGWSWWWVPAAAVAGLLNLRAARRIPGRRPGDLLFAASLVPAELSGWLQVRCAGPGLRPLAARP